MNARGRAGALWAGASRTAAELGDWQARQDTALGARWTVTAQVVRRDDYWSARGSFDLVLKGGGGRGWRWRDVETQVGETVTMRVSGPPEVVQWDEWIR